MTAWIDIDTIAWGQRYAVMTTCRILYILDTAEVASKPGALEWALRTSRVALAGAARAGPR